MKRENMEFTEGGEKRVFMHYINPIRIRGEDWNQPPLVFFCSLNKKSLDEPYIKFLDYSLYPYEIFFIKTFCLTALLGHQVQ